MTNSSSRSSKVEIYLHKEFSRYHEANGMFHCVYMQVAMGVYGAYCIITFPYVIIRSVVKAILFSKQTEEADASPTTL